MNKPRTISILLSVMFLCLVTQLSIAGGSSPQDMIKQTADEVLHKLQREHARLKANPGAIYGLVKSDILPHFDFDRMSRWVLARYWRLATPRQRSRFEQQFQNLLVNTYGNTLLRYSGEKIHYLPTRLDPSRDNAEVRTNLLNPDSGQSVPIDYLLHDSHGEWKVYDLSVDGVSLISNYRESFAEVLKQHGIDGLIQQLERHNRQATG